MFQVGNKFLENLCNCEFIRNASHKKKENEKLIFVFLENVDVAVSSNDPIFTPRDEQPFINEDDGTTSDEDIVSVINVDK